MKGHWGWVQGVGQKVARLTSHPLSLFCPQGFTCKSRVNREYISGRGGQAAFPHAPWSPGSPCPPSHSTGLPLPASQERDPPDVPVQHLVHKGKAPSSRPAVPCQIEIPCSDLTGGRYLSFQSGHASDTRKPPFPLINFCIFVQRKSDTRLTTASLSFMAAAASVWPRGGAWGGAPAANVPRECSWPHRAPPSLFPCGLLRPFRTFPL